MFIWVLLFFLILAASFVLAYQSMNDYREKPQPATSALFLIRDPEGLTVEVFDSLRRKMAFSNALISIERLFRGRREALVIFGPKDILKDLIEPLDLLELEDYSMRASGKESAWEVGLKKFQPLICNNGDPLKVPLLEEKEELWWQFVLHPKTSNIEKKMFKFIPLNRFLGISEPPATEPKQSEGFYAAVKVVAKIDNSERMRLLKPEFTKVGQSAGLIQLPQVYSSEDLIRFYRERSFPSVGLLGIGGFGSSLVVNSEEIRCLIGLKK